MDNGQRDWERDFLSFDRLPITKRHPESSNHDSWGQTLRVQPGNIYEGDVYFWNDVATNLSDGATVGARLRLQLPSTITREAYVIASLSATNAVPNEVYAGDVLSLVGKNTNSELDGSYSASIVPGSVRVWTYDGKSYPLSAADITSTSGALIGCSVANGVLTGYSSCRGQVLFRVKVMKQNFSTRIESNGSESANDFGAAGYTFDVTAEISNNSHAPETKPVFQEILPPGLSFVPGSAETYVNQANGMDTDYEHYDVPAGSSPTPLVVYPPQSIPPSGSVVLVYRVTVSQSVCKGAWEPITSRVWQNGALEQSQLMLNVIDTC